MTTILMLILTVQSRWKESKKKIWQPANGNLPFKEMFESKDIQSRITYLIFDFTRNHSLTQSQKPFRDQFVKYLEIEFRYHPKKTKGILQRRQQNLEALTPPSFSLVVISTPGRGSSCWVILLFSTAGEEGGVRGGRKIANFLVKIWSGYYFWSTCFTLAFRKGNFCCSSFL